MEKQSQEYRVHITVRRKGEPVLTSNELKTEKFNDLDQLFLEMESWTLSVIEEDLDFLEERGSDE